MSLERDDKAKYHHQCLFIRTPRVASVGFFLTTIQNMMEVAAARPYL